MNPDDDVDRLFETLVARVREDIAILTKIGEEQAQSGTAHAGAAEDASRLQELLDQALAATSSPDAAERVKPSRYWGMRFASIHRIVEDDYSDSQYAPAKKAVEKQLYDVAMELAESDRR